jgi:hypothetical protein
MTTFLILLGVNCHHISSLSIRVNDRSLFFSECPLMNTRIVYLVCYVLRWDRSTDLPCVTMGLAPRLHLAYGSCRRQVETRWCNYIRQMCTPLILPMQSSIIGFLAARLNRGWMLTNWGRNCVPQRVRSRLVSGSVATAINRFMPRISQYLWSDDWYWP